MSLWTCLVFPQLLTLFTKYFLSALLLSSVMTKTGCRHHAAALSILSQFYAGNTALLTILCTVAN